MALGLTLVFTAGLLIGHSKAVRNFEVMLDETIAEAITICIGLMPEASMKLDQNGNFLCYLERDDEPLQ